MDRFTLPCEDESLTLIKCGCRQVLWRQSKETAYLLGHKYTVKHVNPAYTDAMCSCAPMSIFHFLAIQLVQVNPNGKARHPVFREYFESKLQEGKTKPQALVCITRRAVRIIYGMMRTKTEYKPFEKLAD